MIGYPHFFRRNHNLPEFQLLIENLISNVDKDLKEEIVDSLIVDNIYLNFIVVYIKELK